MNAGMKEGGARTRGQGPVRDATLPLVSVVTVVYNGAATLENTIKSVLAQSYPNIEYIVVDGGSTDGTLAIIERYADRISYWRSEKDKGIYDAMNKGIGLCTGEWIGLINADDRYEPGVIAKVMEVAAGTASGNIVHGDILIEYPNGLRKLKRAKLSGFLLTYWEMVFNHPSFFVRRKYYATHPFDTGFRVCADHHWTLRAYREDPQQFRYMPLPIATFTIGGASSTIPLGKVLDERKRMSRALGMGWFGTTLSLAVRALFYLPQYAKLKYNERTARN